MIHEIEHEIERRTDGENSLSDHAPSAVRKDGYTVRVSAFEGPLDLLLHLIEKKKLHISDISLAQITDDYLAYIKELEEFPIRDAAHFILVASTLVLIKSRSLLPTIDLTEEEEEDIESLERRLILYKRMKELACFVEDLFGAHPMRYRESRREVIPVFSPTAEITKEQIGACMQNVLLALPRKEAIPQLVVEKVISLEEMIESLIDRIEKNFQTSFRDWSGHDTEEERIHVIVSFLALLELVRRGVITVTQNEHLSDIIMEKHRPARGGNTTT